MISVSTERRRSLADELRAMQRKTTIAITHRELRFVR
jgi:hypothetical protein